jgi:hypothetical protein
MLEGVSYTMDGTAENNNATPASEGGMLLL